MVTYAVMGASGTLGRELIRQILEWPVSVHSIRALARDPHKLTGLLRDFPQRGADGDPIIRPLIGDVRDRIRMEVALENVDVCIHAAALKHIDLGQHDPSEFVRTNIEGTMNVIAACRKNGVKKAIFTSTDKACNPSSVYGSTKMVAEQLFIGGNAGKHKTKFSAVRYGNVLGSNGSVLDLWRQQARQCVPLTITNPEMTRFYITIQDAARLVLKSIDRMTGMEIFIPKLKSATTRQLAETLFPDTPHDIRYSVRPGEKTHEILVMPEEVVYTRDVGDVYIRYPNVEPVVMSCRMRGDALESGFTYSSGDAPRLTADEILEMAK